MSNTEFRDEDVSITVVSPATPNPELSMRLVHIPSGVMVEGTGRSQRKLMNTLLPALRKQWEALQEDRKPRIELDRATIYAVREVHGMLMTEIDKAERSAGEWHMEIERAEMISEKATSLALMLSRQVENRVKTPE